MGNRGLFVVGLGGLKYWHNDEGTLAFGLQPDYGSPADRLSVYAQPGLTSPDYVGMQERLVLGADAGGDYP